MAEDRLSGLIEARHSKDVVVLQCNTGSHWLGCRRMDAWVMRCSYTNPAFIGYEIKTNRSDFLRDEKWRDYLAYCTEFYFVCPSRLIDPKELPEEAGLLWASKSGSRLYIKKKAPTRAVEIPTEIFMYVLMSRCKITRERYDPEDPIDYWRRWLKGKREAQELGRKVSRRISEHVAKMESRMHLLESEARGYDELRAVLDELGISVHDWQRDAKLRAAINGRNDKAIVATLKQVKQTVGKLIEEMEP